MNENLIFLTMKNNNLPKYEDILNKPAFVVSLKRASARYQHTKKLLKDAGFKKIFPFEGLDVVSARDSEEEWDQRLRPFGEMFGTPFKKRNDGTWHKGCGGQLGMKMSIITLWGWLAASNKEGLMIFEDDALPRPDFKEVFPKFWNSIEEENVDMVYVGAQIHPNDFKEAMSDNGYYTKKAAQCLHAHYITKQGARKFMYAMPYLSEYGLKVFNETGENDMGIGTIDSLLLRLSNKVALSNDFKKLGMDPSVLPDFKSISFVGEKIAVKGEYKGRPWDKRDHGIVHQNADLGSTIHGLNVSRMRDEEETKKQGKNVFHDTILEMDSETGESKITKNE